jgi:uncharacterized protein
MLHIISFLVLTASVTAQVYPDSPVFRNYRPESERSGRSNMHAQRIHVFLLERDASAGDPIAQHELGVRYLIGRGVDPDTAKSAFWLKQAAAQQLPPALYNYGLLLANGWGVAWNPVESYSYFLAAARLGMPEAQFVVGVFHTDDLVLPQDWSAAWKWMSLAAEGGHEGGLRGKKEIERRGYVSSGHAAPQHGNETAPSARAQSRRLSGKQESAAGAAPINSDTNDDEWTLLLLDFNADTTAMTISLTRLAHDMIASAELRSADSLHVFSALENGQNDSDALRMIEAYARKCNPEAMLLLGRMHEEGIGVRRDIIAAAKRYLQASWHEAPLALSALAALLSQRTHVDAILRAAFSGDRAAQYVAASLRALEIDLRLTESQARDMIQRAIAAGDSDAIVLLGILHSGGRLYTRDMDNAITAWKHAAEHGNDEAELRLAAAVVVGGYDGLAITDALAILERAASSGSLLAATALAHSYDVGIGRSPNPGIAARMYREAAIRGSRSAYAALRRMYDALPRQATPSLDGR